MLNKTDLKEIDTRISAAKVELLHEMDKMEQRIESRAEVRHSEVFSLVDGLVKEIKENDEFREVITEQVREVRERVSVLEQVG